MIKNIIFDIGNVLADFRWKEFLMEKGCNADEIKRIAKASVMTEAWNEFDRGTLTEEEAFQAFEKNDPEMGPTLRRVFSDISDMVTKREYATEWVKALKKAGYNVYYLSNYSKKAFDECSDSLEFMEYTDGGILSFRELVTKPEPEIYRRLLVRYELKAEECVFFDDTQKNVDAAKEFGINAFLFTTKEQADRDLESLGVTI